VAQAFLRASSGRPGRSDRPTACGTYASASAPPAEPPPTPEKSPERLPDHRTGVRVPSGSERRRRPAPGVAAVQLEAPTDLGIAVDPEHLVAERARQRSKPCPQPSSSIRVPHLSQSSRHKVGTTRPVACRPVLIAASSGPGTPSKFGSEGDPGRSDGDRADRPLCHGPRVGLGSDRCRPGRLGPGLVAAAWAGPGSAAAYGLGLVLPAVGAGIRWAGMPS
jgi:hypothetical protein